MALGVPSNVHDRAAHPAPRLGSDVIFLDLHIGIHRLRVLAEKVVRVTPLRRLWPVPSDNEFNLGVTIHQGVVVGVLDLEKLLGLPLAGRSHPWPVLPGLCVVARLSGGVAGFPVDDVREGRVAAGRPLRRDETLIDLSCLGDSP